MLVGMHNAHTGRPGSVLFVAGAIAWRLLAFMAMVVVVLAIAGVLHRVSVPLPSMLTLGVVCASTLLNAGTQELMFQGYVLRLIESVSSHDLGGWRLVDASGPNWIMGGSFGPEGGFVATIVTLIGIGALWACARTRLARISADAA